MNKKIVISLVIVISVAFISFQVCSLYNLLFNSQAVTVEGEEGIVIRQGKEDSDQVAFTCNVDWGEEVLPDMLEIFETYGIKITFFVSGKWANNNPWLLREIYVRGHEIQNHGYGHRMSSQISEQEVGEEIQKTEDVIRHYIGIRTHTFAPPSGDYDKKTVDICKEMDYTLSLWSVDTIDWRADSTAEVIKERVLSKDLNGAILLMHPKEETVKALPEIIEEIGKRDLTIVPFSELMI